MVTCLHISVLINKVVLHSIAMQCSVSLWLGSRTSSVCLWYTSTSKCDQRVDYIIDNGHHDALDSNEVQ